MDRLTATLNGDDLYSIAAPETFEASGPFEIVLDNQEQAVHVHLNLDETLSTVASLRTTNYYVERNRTQTVTVDVDPRETEVSGRLKLVTGYGAEVAYTTVTVAPPEKNAKRVAVDDSLSKPTPSEPAEPGVVDRLADFADAGPAGFSAPVIVVGLLALGLSAAVAASIGSTAVLAGSLVVLLGVAASLAVSARRDDIEPE
ncbi:MAG: hypothetical protein ABEH61_05720 [Haloarculaceae archaeon]